MLYEQNYATKKPTASHIAEQEALMKDAPRQCIACTRRNGCVCLVFKLNLTTIPEDRQDIYKHHACPFRKIK